MVNQRQQVGLGGLVDGCERLVQQDDRRVLNDGSRKQGALKLSGRQHVKRGVGDRHRAGALHRRLDRRPACGIDSPGKSQPRPRAHFDDVTKPDRHPCVELGSLSKKGDLRRHAAMPGELAADQRQGAEDGFDKRRLAGAVMPDNSKHIASRHVKRDVADDGLPPITEGQLVRRQDHERCLSGQPVTVDAMMTHSMAQVALTPRSRLAVLSSVKLKPGLVRPAMALECIGFSSRGHPPQMRISTCLAGILAHGHRVYVPAFPGFPSGVSDTPTAHSCGYSPGFAP